jgi:hypothetical protein
VENSGLNSELNSYLQVLEGFADIEFIERESHDVSGKIRIKFTGDTGSIDKGEIELTFYGVTVMYLPFRLMPSCEVGQNDVEVDRFISPQDQEDDCHLYTLKDDSGTVWWVYAEGFEMKVLPIFYGK